MAALPWRGHTWRVGLIRYQFEQEGYFQCLWWMWCSRHGSILSLLLIYTAQCVPLYLFCSKAAEAGELKVTCGWARGCNTGHGSCLSLLLVSCVAASGTACTVHIWDERKHHARGTLHHLTAAACEIIALLIFFSKENRADNGVYVFE